MRGAIMIAVLVVGAACSGSREDTGRSGTAGTSDTGAYRDTVVTGGAATSGTGTSGATGGTTGGTTAGTPAGTTGQGVDTVRRPDTGDENRDSTTRR